MDDIDDDLGYKTKIPLKNTDSKSAKFNGNKKLVYVWPLDSISELHCHFV